MSSSLEWLANEVSRRVFDVYLYMCATRYADLDKHKDFQRKQIYIVSQIWGSKFAGGGCGVRAHRAGVRGPTGVFSPA